MKRYIVSGSILLALSMACEDKKKTVRKPAPPVVQVTEVTSSPEINLPSINSAPKEEPKVEVAKEKAPVKDQAPAETLAKTPEPEKMTLSAKTVPIPVVQYEDTTTRDLAEGSANEIKDEGLARIREKALARARELEAEEAARDKEAEQVAAAEAEALAQTEKAEAPEAVTTESAEINDGAKVAMVEPNAPASELGEEQSETAPAAELPMEEPVKFKQGLDKKAAKRLEIQFHKAVALTKAGKVEQAKNEFLSLCQSGHAHACHKFAWYEEQAGNKSNASRFYRAACDNGLGKSCNNLAFQFEQKKNYDEALSLYSKGCLEKHEASCASLKRVREEQKIEGLQTR